MLVKAFLYHHPYGPKHGQVKVSKTPDGRVVTSDTLEKGEANEHFVEWREPTMRAWDRVLSRQQNPFLEEERMWRFMLLETSLAGGIKVENDETPEADLKKLMRFRPSALPAFMVQELRKEVQMTSEEMNRIERECFTLWGSAGGNLRNPHPLLEKVISAMSLYDKLGIVQWPSPEDIPVKTYTAIKHVLNCYARIMNLDEKQRAARASAVQQAGIQQFVGPPNPYPNQ